MVNGVRGTLALGLFYHGKAQFGDGASADADAEKALATGFGRNAQTLEQLMGVRVAKEEEIEGLDIGEHGNEADPNFTPVGGK